MGASPPRPLPAAGPNYRPLRNRRRAASVTLLLPRAATGCLQAIGYERRQGHAEWRSGFLKSQNEETGEPMLPRNRLPF